MSSQTKLIKDILSLYDTILENKEVDETADSLRNTLDSLGYDEKGSELTSGGNVNDTLTDIVSDILKNYKQTNPTVSVVITGGNDKYHHGLNYKSKHTEGNAIDLTISPYNSKNASDFLKILDGMKSRDNKFSYLDEYTHPSGAATAGHFHLQYGGEPAPTSSTTTSGDTTSDKPTSSTSDKPTSSTSDIKFNSGQLESDPMIRQFGNLLNKALNLDKGLTENIKRIKGLLK